MTEHCDEQSSSDGDVSEVSEVEVGEWCEVMTDGIGDASDTGAQDHLYDETHTPAEQTWVEQRGIKRKVEVLNPKQDTSNPEPRIKKSRNLKNWSSNVNRRKQMDRGGKVDGTLDPQTIEMDIFRGGS